MTWKDKYNYWLNFSGLNRELLQQLEDNKKDEKLLEDFFYKNLEFGTGGMRGEMGPGTNRINLYTIRKVTKGLSGYIESFGEEAKKRGVAIAYDSRHKSYDFAMETAKTLGTQGIKAYVFETLRPTPELSFAVRYLNAFAGIVITASHNPPEYNGYKVYGEDGSQISLEVANEITDKINEIENELLIKVESEEKLKEINLIQIIGKEIDDLYIERLKTISLNPSLFSENNIKVVFTPLHGTSNLIVRKALENLNFKNVIVVKEQELPDSNFSTVSSPNPEEHSAFEIAIEYGKKYNADILIGTDPDADRLGVVVKDEEEEYKVLTGNQTGALFLDYILTQKQQRGILPSDGVVLKTIVTSDIGREIAKSYNLETLDTLTGFKFIGEKIKEYEMTNQYQFLFGYEDSYGYLIGDFVRDKDAIQAAIFAVEVASYHKSKGLSLNQALNQIFEKYGYYEEGLESFTLKGKEGTELIQGIMSSFRSEPLKEIAGEKVEIIEDYKSQIRQNVKNQTEEIITLPNSNVLKYYLKDGSWFCLRPSGTEPKIKFYFGVKESSELKSKEKLTNIRRELSERVNRIINELKVK